MRNVYRILLSVIFVGCFAAHAQTRPITGSVRDADGPVPGATVFEKGYPGAGVSADAEGKFKLNLHGKGNLLMIQAVGYQSKEVTINGQSVVNVIVAIDSKGLNEAVVVGYGVQKKINVTGAVSTINHADLMQTPSTSIQNTLSGKLPGFFSQQRGGMPGADGADFYIRGVSTPSGNQSPLILVDDVIFNYADFSNLDPNEVESISVLKDAATTAPYGIEGANGVILVTTRRGKVGTAKINVRSEYGIMTPTQRPHFLDAYNTALLRNEATKNDAIIAGSLSSYVAPFSSDDLQKYKDGSDPYGHPNNDWYKILFKTITPTSTTNADISGGTDRVQYFVSVGYSTQDGMLRSFKAPNDPYANSTDNNYKFNRFNFRSNLDIKPTKTTTISLNFSGNTTVQNNPKYGAVSGGGEGAAFLAVYNYESLNPYIYPIKNPNGSYGFTNPNATPPGGNNIIGQIAYGGYTRKVGNLMNLNVAVVQKLDAITRGLQAKINVAGSSSEENSSSLSRNNFPSYYYNPADQTYTPRDATIYRVDPFAYAYSAGDPIRQSSIQANLSYARSFGKNNVSGLIVANQSSFLRPDVDANGADKLDSYIPTNLRGLTSRETYNWNNKYMAEFDASYNGTDKFAANKKYGFFPAGSVGWNVAEENFVRNNFTFVNSFKLRASYGIVGSDNLPNGALNSYEENYIRTLYNSFGETNTAYHVITPSTLSNTNVSWEKEKKLDIGADFAFFERRLTGTVDVFRNQRSDILTTLQTVPTYYGVPSSGLPPENIGIVDNNGFEVELNYHGRLGRDFNYRFKGTFSYAKNKIVQEDEVPPLYPWQKQTGKSLGTNLEWIWDGFYSASEAADPKVAKYIGSTVAGVPNTTLPGFLKYRDVNHDGKVDNYDMGYFGKSNLPTTVVGFNMGFTWKRFSMDVLLQSALDYTIQANYNFATPWKANLQEIALSRWTPETASSAKYPALVSNFHGTYMTSGNWSTFWSIPGDYLRIKSVEMSYQVPDRLVNRIGVKGLRIYANAFNLYTWSASIKKYGLDPESVNSAGASGATGIYPQQAIINFGINVSVK